MNLITIRAAVATAMTLVVCSAAQAGIIGAYDWVAYNSLTAYIGTTNPLGDFDASYAPAGNITDFTYDGDRPGYTTTGELIDYDTGGGTSVDMSVAWGGQGQLFIEAGHENITPGASEFDVLSPNYKGKVVLHGAEHQVGDGTRTQTLTFTGLDPAMTYVFYGIAESDPTYYDSYSIIDLLSTDDATNESTLTSIASINTLTGFGINSSLQSFLGNGDDDLTKFTGIRSGADGTFSVRVTAGFIGRRGHAPGFDAIALTQSGGAGGVMNPPVDPPPPPLPPSSAPEPSTYVLATLGLLGLGLMGRRQRKRGRRRRLA